MHTSVLYTWVVGGIGIQYACVINCAWEVCHRFFSLQYITSFGPGRVFVCTASSVTPQFLLCRRIWVEPWARSYKKLLLAPVLPLKTGPLVLYSMNNTWGRQLLSTFSAPGVKLFNNYGLRTVALSA